MVDQENQNFAEIQVDLRYEKRQSRCMAVRGGSSQMEY